MSNIKPSWWGSSVWQTIYSIVAVYPQNPDIEQKNAIKNFFISLKHLLPCNSCRESYNKFIEENDTNVNNDKNFNSRDNLIKFVYSLRNKVNAKLDNNYNVSLNYFKKKLDNMISDNNNNIDAYLSSMSEVPFIPMTYETKILNFLKKKTNYNPLHTKEIIIICKKFMENPIFDIKNKEFKLFYKRNIACRKIIDKIYLNMGINDYCNLESFYKDRELHLKLFYLGATILSCEELNKIF